MALAGAMISAPSTYTAALLSATGTPVWASAPCTMATQFGSSSIVAAGELVVSAFAEKRYHVARVGEPLRKGPVGTSYKAGALALLAGGMVMRQAIFQAGNKSAERPDNYFRLTQRPPEGAKPRRRVDRAIEGRKIGGNSGRLS